MKSANLVMLTVLNMKTANLVMLTVLSRSIANIRSSRKILYLKKCSQTLACRHLYA